VAALDVLFSTAANSSADRSDRNMAGIPFVKGHATKNDFVLLPDPNGSLTLTDAQVRALCDRRSGIGGDGVIRIIQEADRWFMDYRNADGSLAEMCGNGARLFARFLYATGWVGSGPFQFGTRGGVRSAHQENSGDIAIGMGLARLGAAVTGEVMTVDGQRLIISGPSVDVGNPHLVTTPDRVLEDLDLSIAPNYPSEAFPDGVNIEFLVRTGPRSARMRVFERGVGETQSCGTGTVAAAAALLAEEGLNEGVVSIEVPGGTVRVEVNPAGCTLVGNAEIVASGWIDDGWWRSSGTIAPD
jgi:diaminopimelate epimerase